MNARHTCLYGLAALGLALAAPVHAMPDFLQDRVILVKQDRVEERDARRDDRGDRRSIRRDDQSGYGTGFERRQSKRDRHDESDDDRRRRR